MTGLMYQDFVTAKGKWILAGMAAVFAGILALVSMMGSSDAIVLGIAVVALCMGASLILGQSLSSMIVSDDEKLTTRNYLLSLPLGAKKYVAEKYIFMGVYYYAMNMFVTILLNICACSAGADEKWMGIISGLSGVYTLLAFGMLFFLAIEYPFVFAFGAKWAGYVRTAILALLMFLLFVFMLFGDISIWDNIELFAVFERLTSKTILMNTISIVWPAIVLLVYYLSYRISAALFKAGRERMYE